MQSDFFSCLVCSVKFDAQNHLPKLIPICGHTLCLACLTGAINNQKECPIDHKKFLNLPQQSEDFPTNQLVLQVVEQRLNQNYGTCNQHGKPKNLVCLADNVQICEECKSNHEGHDIKEAKELKDKAETQKRRFETLVENFTNTKEEVRTHINDLRKSGRRQLETGFEKAIDILKERQKETVSKFEALWESEKEEIEKKIDEDDRLKKKYEDKIDDLNDQSNKRFFRTLDKFEKKTFTFKTNRILDEFREKEERSAKALDIFTDSLISYVRTIDFNILDRTYYWESIKDIGGLEVDILNLQNILDLKFQGTQLLITPKTPTLKPLRFLNMSSWYKIKSFEIQFNEGEPTVEQFRALKKIYPYRASLSLRFKNPNLTDDHLENLISEPFWGSGLKKFVLDLRTSQVTDRGLIKLITEWLPHMYGIKDFELIVDQIKITDNSILELAKHFHSRGVTLKRFVLQIPHTEITDSSIIELFKSMRMGNIKEISLNFGCTNITDQSLIGFSQENLKYCSNLESLKLFLYKTQITDHGLKIFCEHAKNSLQRTVELVLNLVETQITDDSILYFSHDVLTKMTSLDNLVISLCSTKVSDSSIKSLNHGLTKTGIVRCLNKLKLYLSKTKITGNGIKIIADLIDLKSLTRLIDFDLEFDEIQIDDTIMKKISEIQKEILVRNLFY